MGMTQMTDKSRLTKPLMTTKRTISLCNMATALATSLSLVAVNLSHAFTKAFVKWRFVATMRFSRICHHRWFGSGFGCVSCLIDKGGNFHVLVMLWAESYRPQHLADVIDERHHQATWFHGQGIAPTRQRWGIPSSHVCWSGWNREDFLAMALLKTMFGDDWNANFVEMNASDERSILLYAPKSRSLLVVVLLEHISITKGRRFRFRSMLSSLTNATT